MQWGIWLKILHWEMLWLNPSTLEYLNISILCPMWFAFDFECFCARQIFLSWLVFASRSFTGDQNRTALKNYSSTSSPIRSIALIFPRRGGTHVWIKRKKREKSGTSYQNIPSMASSADRPREKRNLWYLWFHQHD